MQLRDVLDNWNDLSYQKKIRALHRVVEYIEYEEDILTPEQDKFLYYLIQFIVEEFEDEDFFGTEGLKI